MCVVDTSCIMLSSFELLRLLLVRCRLDTQTDAPRHLERYLQTSKPASPPHLAFLTLCCGQKKLARNMCVATGNLDERCDDLRTHVTSFHRRSYNDIIKCERNILPNVRVVLLLGLRLLPFVLPMSQRTWARAASWRWSAARSWAVCRAGASEWPRRPRSSWTWPSRSRSGRRAGSEEKGAELRGMRQSAIHIFHSFSFYFQ